MPPQYDDHHDSTYQDLRHDDRYVALWDEINRLRESIRKCRNTHHPECDGMLVCVCDERDRHRDLGPR